MNAADRSSSLLVFTRKDGGATVHAQQRQAARLAKREAYYLQRGYPKGLRRTSAGHYNVRRMRNGKDRNLGTYATVEEAAAAITRWILPHDRQSLNAPKTFVIETAY